jgi:membrane-bound ClpP family serine protease
MWQWFVDLLSSAMIDLVYLALGVGGLVYSLFSLAFGGDGDHDGELGADGDHDAVAGDHGPSLLSIRVIAMFATGFGAVGYLVHHYNPTRPLFSAFCGLLGGFALGGFGFAFLRLFYRQQATSVIRTDDLLGSSGTVVTSIPKGGIGEVSLTARGALVTKPARSESGEAISNGAPVEIVRVVGDTLIVRQG